MVGEDEIGDGSYSSGLRIVGTKLVDILLEGGQRNEFEGADVRLC
jgi:hypothetical protein